ncbi:ATP-dependent DNA helicase pif1 [Eumeta japonica]|uniref:ATP-dependent DNA helicase n=1 Tax=Eumeta variegata TaxID=151549 RepID=A0A4C1XXC4_EUMVA|nr:ATP-dependent DNA helicase pif1 [Eumeta japonica]
MENPVSGIPKNSLKAKVIQDCVFVVWDKCTMANEKSIEAVNRTMQDIRSNKTLFGGVIFLFAGDFRQILPVVIKSMRTDEITVCSKRSVFWRHCKKLHRKENMRSNSADSEFSEIFLDVREEKCSEVNSIHDIELPTGLCQVVADTEILIHSIYDDIHNLNIKEDSWLCARSILAPTNDQVTAFNQRILDKLSRESQTYLSINTVCNPDEVVNYPTEFLNSIIVPGLPPHKLELKIGVPITLFRNLNPPKLCNGTRLRVMSLQINVIEGHIISGCGKADDTGRSRRRSAAESAPCVAARVRCIDLRDSDAPMCRLMFHERPGPYLVADQGCGCIYLMDRRRNVYTVAEHEKNNGGKPEPDREALGGITAGGDAPSHANKKVTY